ncbi:hypothetical protein CAEBREN_07440 [Caenorhabditis brenneri]|uniref:DUF38 domain-containing protein n=1 Tax=Caenorhabditis brenneri TaxID=135651 RepID=G0MML6_CAEBE|nr:hypothetical protein CAEBREN_07440 [Caenorhabditis brenneri]
MSTTLMSLESLHFLLPYMDANRRLVSFQIPLVTNTIKTFDFRFEIRQRCPSLREFERNVPLKINSLVLTESSVILNDTIYQLGIYRKCKAGKVPRHVAEKNKVGGVPYEVNEYGLKDESNALPVTPGEVVMSQHKRPLMQDEDYIESIEDATQFWEGQLADLQGMRPSPWNLEGIHQVEQNIEDCRVHLFDYHCRREKFPSNYEMFLQLTKSQIVEEQEQTSVERYKHNKKFSETMKQMTTLLLGGRSSPVSVKTLEIDFAGSGVIRLPINLELRIEQLVFRMHSETTVGVLAPILHESSFPLKKLYINYWSDEDATNTMVKTAESLRIRYIYTDVPQAISSLTNPLVRISNPVVRMPHEQNIERIVRNWIESQRPVGHKYIFDFYSDPRFPNEIEDMAKELNGVIIDDENLIIPMNNATQLKVSYGSFPDFAPRSKWAVKFLTEAVEH